MGGSVCLWKCHLPDPPTNVVRRLPPLPPTPSPTPAHSDWVGGAVGGRSGASRGLEDILVQHLLKDCS